MENAMRIWSALSGPTPGLTERRRGAGELQRSEVIDDIFNHQPPEEEERGAVRVHLSHASRALMLEFRQDVEGFLIENPDVDERLVDIPLPGEGEGEPLAKAPIKATVLRRLGAYVRWLESASEELSSPGDVPFESMSSLGKDDAIRSLVQEHQDRRQNLQSQRQKHQPNYYYMVYPETYAFN